MADVTTAAASWLSWAELASCIARAGYDKYRNVTPMGPGAKVAAFISNLLGEDDEEGAVYGATGGKRDAE